MGINFRKSIKVAPGVKLNLGKKSAGISIGGKYGGMSFNTKSGTRARISAPGTGLSYSTKVSRTTATNTSKNSTKSSGGGCLLTCLKGMGILFLLSFFVMFGWIAGLIWILFLRKKTAPDKQKQYTIAISGLSILSFVFFIYGMFFSPPSPTALTLVSTVEGTTLEIDTDYVITVQYEPKDATLSNVKYLVDNSLLATITTDSDNPSIITLHTKREGAINITAQQNTIESNTLTFDIVDTARIEQETKAEQKRIEEETLKASEEKKLAEETASREAEEKRLAEEKAEKEAEEQNLQEEAEKQALATQQPNQSEESAQTATSTSSESQTMVWIDDTAKRYHKSNGCGMNNAYQVTLEKALALGKTACGRCY